MDFTTISSVRTRLCAVKGLLGRRWRGGCVEPWLARLSNRAKWISLVPLADTPSVEAFYLATVSLCYFWWDIAIFARLAYYVAIAHFCRPKGWDMRDVLARYPDVLTVPEVAEILRVHRTYVYRLIREGRLRALRTSPKKTRVMRADLQHFLDAASQAQPRPSAHSGK